MEIEYRVIGINIAQTKAPDTEEASKQIKMPKEFLEKEFPNQYVQKREVNTALQCQTLLCLYGKFGWEHYQQGQLGAQIMLYFKREKKEYGDLKIKLEPSEESLIQKLDPAQKPH